MNANYLSIKAMKTYQQFINEMSSYKASTKVKVDNDLSILQNLYNANQHLSYEKYIIFVNDNYTVLHQTIRAGQRSK